MNGIVACLESIQFIPENNVFNTLHHTSHPWTHLITSNIRSLNTHHISSLNTYLITSNIRSQKQNHPEPVAFAPWWNILSYFSVISRNLKNATVLGIWMKSKWNLNHTVVEIWRPETWKPWRGDRRRLRKGWQIQETHANDGTWNILQYLSYLQHL